ncbi:DUF4412 domain-containing protein [Confluentibacter sediminis]|uniref:DUF4412 domain-containing protein n=1 Tax=Confluentibacter sediminis TaxID=2219045 RepID=UPI000DAD49BA|nr:DUF4412 domain-containing protein [Confluentibacter sediminis]
MKTNKILMSLVVCFALIQTVEAQFLKKLQKRVEQKVENTIVEKTANKAAEKTSKSMDKAFNMNPFGGGKEKADPNLIASSYDFSWKYSLKMTSKEGDMVFDYYLKPGAAYFGFTSATMENMFTVMDNKNKVTTIFMQTQGNNMAMVNKMPDDLDLEEAKDTSASFNFTQLPDKTINGYHCKGVKATNDEYEMVMYFTNEAEVSFDDIYKNQQTKIPVQLKDYFDPKDKILMISMDMKGLKNKKLDAKMECVGLEKISKDIKKSDYKFM